MNDLEELMTLVPPRDPPPPAVDWEATRAALGVDVPADYKALVEHYGSGSIAGLRLFVPGHPHSFRDLLRQVDNQRWVLRYLIEEDVEQPYDPDQLLPWGIDDAGNTVWWWMRDDWPVVANEARGEDWDRYDGAIAMLTGLLSGRVASEFLTIEGHEFLPFDYEPD